MKLVIGNKNYSSWSLRPWILLKSAGVEFEEIRIPLYQGDSQKKISEYTSAKKVPVLVDDELRVWDSLAICEYISENYMEGKGWPDSVEERAHCRSISAEMHSGFFEIRNNLPMDCKADLKLKVSEATLKEIQRIDDIWSVLIKRNKDKGEYLFGRFTIADCMYAPVVIRFNTYGVSLSASSQKYVSTLLANPHIQEWISAGKAEMEVIEF